MARARRIVVCDRSPDRTRDLTTFLERDSDLEVAATFASVGAMVAALGELAPDLIALDLATAGDDVPAAIESLRREGPVPVLILGGEAGSDETRVDAALGAGALEAIAGEKLDLRQPDGIWATALRSRIKRLASHHSGRSGAAMAAPPVLSGPLEPDSGARCRAIGIGASVGGPPALATVLGQLPSDFGLPVLVVQHMAVGFGKSLAQWLDRTIEIPVTLAVDGSALQPGVWLAPDGVHLRLSSGLRLMLDATTERGAHRPSLDVLLESLAESLAAEGVGVVLTGMGRDGADGVRAIAAAGGLTIAQTEETSAVFGMPAAAIEAGAREVLPLEEIGPRLLRLGARSEPR